MTLKRSYIAALILAALVWLMPIAAHAEYIDGPANIRSAPDGGAIITLESGTSVKVLSSEGDWYYIEFDVVYPMLRSHDLDAIPKGTLLYDDAQNEIGNTLETIKTSPTMMEIGKYRTTIKGYIHRSRIHK